MAAGGRTLTPRVGRPYADMARAYVAAGWRGVLPLPPRKKKSPPPGYTGAAGVDPSLADIQTWCDCRPADSNLALRLPPDVVGIDVDNYGGKPGAGTLRRGEADLGPLPPTVLSTSRHDGVSGIRLYRVPARPSWSDLGPGVEIIHHAWRYLVAWPSIHQDTGRTYRWVDQRTGEILESPPAADDLPDLPPGWVERLSSDQARPVKADVDTGEVFDWLRQLADGPPCQTVSRALATFGQVLGSGGSRHTATLAPVAALVRAGEQGHRGVPAALSEARTAFLAAVTRPGDGRRTDREAVAEWRRGVAGAYRIVKADPTPANRHGCRCATAVGTAREETPHVERPVVDLAQIIDAAREYLDLPDPAPLLVTLAVGATRDLEELPVWLLVVGAASGGKTEAISVLDDVADARLDDVTAAGMLSWKGGKKPAPVGVLTRVPTPNALVTFGDLSSLLASSDRGGRDQTFALLRKTYDGHVVRDLGNAPEPLKWEGRLTVVGAVTDAIDNYAAHADALGPRWVYLRLPRRDTEAKRRAARIARRGGLEQARDHLRHLASEAVTIAARYVNAIEIPDPLADQLESAALVCAWGRAAVPRHGYGRRDIDGLPSIEEPGRIVRQLRGLARGALALGLDPGYVAQLVRRVALDSMPAARRQTLDVLADGEPLTTAAIARRGGMHRHVARRQLEEFEAIGLVRSDRAGAEPGEDEPDRRTATWKIAGEDGAVVAQVIDANRRGEGAGWHET
jgi:hypothetical protein